MTAPHGEAPDGGTMEKAREAQHLAGFV
jgi:hypothetical protein